MRNGRKRPFWHVGPTKTWSACVSMQSDWSLRCTHEETLHPWLSKNEPREDSDPTARLRSWSESSLGAHVRRYVFWRFAVTRKQKQTFRSAVTVFGGRQHSQAVIWQNPDANIYNVCLFVTKKYKKYRNVYWVNIMHSIPYKINNYWYNSFDFISSLKENNGFFLICGHISRRIYNNCSDFEKLSRVICLW